MVQFECPRVIHPFLSFTFGLHADVSISLNAGKGKCCMWPVNKVEIRFAKIGCVDCEWSNLNVPGSYYTPWSYSLFISGLPNSLDAGKGECSMWPVNKVEISFPKICFVPQVPLCHSLLGSIVGCPFHSMQEKGNAACGLLIKWKFILQKQVLWT